MTTFLFSGKEIADENGKVEADDYDRAIAYVHFLERELADWKRGTAAIIEAAGGEVRVPRTLMMESFDLLRSEDMADPFLGGVIYTTRRQGHRQALRSDLPHGS